MSAKDAIFDAMSELLDAIEAFKEEQENIEELRAENAELWQRAEQAEKEAKDWERQFCQLADQGTAENGEIKDAREFLLEYEFLLGQLPLEGNAKLDADRLRRRTTHWLQRVD